jgi:hypothetical protein
MIIHKIINKGRKEHVTDGKIRSLKALNVS